MLEGLSSLLDKLEEERKESNRRVSKIEDANCSDQVHILSYYFLELLGEQGIKSIRCNGHTYSYNHEKQYFNLDMTPDQIMTIHWKPEEFFIKTKELFETFPDWRNSIPMWILQLQLQVTEHKIKSQLYSETRNFNRGSLLALAKEANDIAGRTGRHGKDVFVDARPIEYFSVPTAENSDVIWDDRFPFQKIKIFIPGMAVKTANPYILDEKAQPPSDDFLSLEDFLDTFVDIARRRNPKIQRKYQEEYQAFLERASLTADQGWPGLSQKPILGLTKIPYNDIATAIEEEVRDMVFILYQNIFTKEYSRIHKAINESV